MDYIDTKNYDKGPLIQFCLIDVVTTDIEH